ncbi:MAG: cupin domain-containing protein, partial [Gaiellales bacterium]
MLEPSDPVRATDARRTETPNAVMTTLASPTLGPSDGPSLWLVTMVAGSAGPLHVFDSQQIWSVLEGTASIAIEGVAHELATGDTIVVPANAPRRVSAPVAARLVVCGRGDAIVSVPGEG